MTLPINFKKIIKYLLIIVLTAATALYLAKNFTHYFDTPVITYQTKITEKEVIKNESFSTSNASTRSVAETIKIIQNNQDCKLAHEKLVLQLPNGATSETIQREINRLNVDVALAEPTDEHSGTNIYAIKINKHKNALGIYVGANVEHCCRDASAYGIHYRHDRMGYQIGKTFAGEMECRVVWEAIQW